MPELDVTPRPAESVSNQLTRIEGKFDLLAYRMDDLAATVKEHSNEISALKMFTQRLSDDAKASHETAISLAKALKEADEARRDKSEQSWSPFQRAALVVAALVGIAGIVLAALK